jgi:hypothetical protein
MVRRSQATARSRISRARVCARAAVVIVAITAIDAVDARDARADEATLDAARQAYDRGAAAYDAADYPKAASELARADELFANDVAIELAIKAAMKSDDARTAITLAARAERRTRSGTLGAAAVAARTKMAGRTGTVNVICPGRTWCVAKLDGKDLPPSEPYVVLVGQHKVVIEGGEAPRESYDVRVDPDAAIVIRALPPPVAGVGPKRPAEEGPARAADRAPSESPSRNSGISPTWFWVGVGLTAALGGAAIASALDTQSKHDDFRASPSPELQQAGLDAQLRTNLLAGGAGFAAVASAVVGVFFVGWSSPPPSGASAARAGFR